MEYEYNLPVVSGDEILLNVLSNKIGRGKELSLIESDMAIIAASHVEGNRYGPLPAEMEAGETILPEQVKGIIARAIG